ncbi:LacI family DNA-binding transcriptional regulator [Sandaracinobacteroides saxicola]|uniref:LacI family DNA-binding transcriptional regulator n=1 Tax=Sandaracinobacteroides saxicola TaxID=2759707 RepID=A0A7G5II70_9SPHN|nr:LacI family DNA-binding transcriptional regulator [Sandaracinobacteroides saxicola]QMW23062.1 LacI family DNA-binding transcriptional regulator [Sandaracinobacteroides saxicola]
MPKPKRASSTDVARLAGVSQSAVSRAFSPGAIVSVATREKVRAAAAQLGYRPNALASSLITKRTNIVALMTGDIANPHYARTINAFSLGLQERGLHVLLFSLTDGQDVEAAVEEVLKYRVDGVIMISAALSAEVGEACAKVGVPVVLYNRYASQPNVSSVRIENRRGGAMVAEHLAGNGHRQLGFIAGTRVDRTSEDREWGFVSTLASVGAFLTARVEGDYSFESGRAAMHEMMRAVVVPTAVFAASDLMAFGALDAARHDLKLRVPQDIAIVGFDDLPAAGWPSYDLSTIRQPVEAMATAAVRLLLERVGNAAAEPQTLLVPGTLIKRGSSAITR